MNTENARQNVGQNAGRHWRAVELDKILHLLAEETACDDAAVLAREIKPVSSLEVKPTMPM